MNNEERFLNRIDETVHALLEQKYFIKDSLNNPRLIFDDAANKFSSKKDTIFQIMHVYENDERKMSQHEFQSFLCSIVDTYFKQQFNDDRIEVKVRNKNSYPSLYAVYFEGSEVIQFDIFKKYYGFQSKKTTEEVEKDHNERKIEHEEELKRLQDKIKGMQEAKMNPYRYIYNFHKNKKKNIFNKLYYSINDFYWVIFKKKKLQEGLDKLANKYESQISERKSTFERYNNYEESIAFINRRDKAIQLIEPIFVKHDYRLETERYKLF